MLTNSATSEIPSVIIKQFKAIKTPYKGIKLKEYNVEKRRLQLELLNIQQAVANNGQRLAICFDGRDAAGKGSTIKRFYENLMPMYSRIVALGVPTKSESTHWFRRYEKQLPKAGEMVLFDRSWYNRALIEPTMGYCSKTQYQYFMRKVLDWEHRLIDDGLILIKFYLSVDSRTQLYRFQERLSDPLKYWKFSENDLHARDKWERFTAYKEQMLKRTSSEISPWVEVNSNSELEARLTCMLHVVRSLSEKRFTPLTGEDVRKTYDTEVNGVVFKNLTATQYAALEELVNSAEQRQKQE